MPGRGGSVRRSGAFTIVEVLVVIAVIVVLLSILIVAVRAATSAAQRANTRALMGSIKQALVRFREDVGYLPPVLGDPDPENIGPVNNDLRKLFDPRGEDLEWRVSDIDNVTPQQPNGAPNDNYLANVQEWYSMTTIAEYLIGYGHHQQDGYGNTPSNAFPDETPPVGIRNPGSDGVWGATLYGAEDGSLSARMMYPGGGGGAAESNVDIGRVYGPYLELKDERLLAAVDYDAQGNLVVSFPGDGNFDPLLPRTVVDYWGNPILFYRRLYAPGSLASQYYALPDPTDPNASPHVPTLSDVFVLRPWEVRQGGAIDGLPDVGGDTTTTVALQSAEFALLSAGPDRTINPDLRYDDPDDPANAGGIRFSGGSLDFTSFANEDNIVELGP